MDDVSSHPSRPTSEELSDALGRARQGDEDSLARLVDTLSPILVSWAQAHLRPAPLAWTTVDVEDLVHEVWLRALPRLSTLRPHPNSPKRLTPALLALLGTILRSRVTDIRRRAARSRLHDVPPPLVPDPPAASSGPLSKTLRSERRQLVEEALATLSERERRLYVDRLLGNLTIDELAAEFGMTPKAVIKARQRVRAKLEKILRPHFLEELEPED